MPSLLERQAELQMLGTAVERAGTGRGSAVLVLGEAGIGKTSLVHAFLAAASGRARVLAGACEDLLTPRVLGPLRDAARSAPGGPLASGLAAAGVLAAWSLPRGRARALTDPLVQCDNDARDAVSAGAAG